MAVTSPVGSANDAHIRAGIEQHSVVIPMWGNNGSLLSRDLEVREIIKQSLKPHHAALSFGTTKQGQPKHPLYLPKSTELELFV